MGERKNLKLAWCELIARNVLGKGYSLNELRKADFDYIFSVCSRLMKIRDDYKARETEAQQNTTRRA